MTINIGTPDRIARVLLGLVLVLLPFVSGFALFESAFWLWASVVVGLVLVVTGALRFCPAYRLIGFTSAKDEGE